MQSQFSIFHRLMTPVEFPGKDQGVDWLLSSPRPEIKQSEGRGKEKHGTYVSGRSCIVSWWRRWRWHCCHRRVRSHPPGKKRSFLAGLLVPSSASAGFRDVSMHATARLLSVMITLDTLQIHRWRLSLTATSLDSATAELYKYNI